ncbi:DUF5808 domain-containing protein [Paenibacillus flagellatus]|uniref:DUF5808 domain-containing protein n=1 Tax=Paenibacillus flagellatus TaxID=2211139 RepID=A0A2V5JXE7_9BACL|nr:DUF5808 domain-containing protein [Paenibacillus flagellatus]PYI51341.1 hypothetical protein DLM86_25280 [Paenibacillus flagellatus]
MLTIILSVAAAVHFVVLAATYRSQARYKNGMLFAVTLPDSAPDDGRIRSIQSTFKKRHTQACVGMAVFLVPFLLLYNSAAYQVIYFFAWFSVSFVVMPAPFRRAFRETLAVKREKEWFVGAKRVIQSDLRAAYLKNRRSAPVWLFAIPLAMALGLLLWGAGESSPFLTVASGSLVVTIVLLLVSLQARKAKAKVYSLNSDVNVSLNQAKRSRLSYMWLGLAVLENVHCALIGLLLSNENERMFGVWLTITLLFSAIPLAIVWYVYRGIARLERETLALDGQVVYTDDDEYWINGFTYHNPYDRSVFVPKRIGMGETVNTATLAGKLLVWIPIGIAVVVVIGVSFLLVRSEIVEPVLTVTPEHTIEIDYPMYSYEFNVTDIEELALVESLPSGRKTNGEGTNQVARGHFKLNELGQSRLYVFKAPPYIRIKLPDGYVFYNERDPQQTERLFEQLRKRVAE